MSLSLVHTFVKLSLASVLFLSCSQNENVPEREVKEVKTESVPPLELFISIPQNSGLAFVDYATYSIRNDSLLVVDANFFMPADDTEDNYRYDTTAIYQLDPDRKNELRSILTEIDSLGNHSAYGCVEQMGWPRFFISTHMDGEDMNGFIANCYREHIFRLVDFMNDCYPKGKVINYSKEELIQTEKDCEEYDYGSNQSN